LAITKARQNPGSGFDYPGFALVMACLLAGCSRNIKPPSTVPVSGVVTMQGKPAVGIRVKFHPQFNMGRIKYIPVGETGPEGQFTLSTGAPANGAPPGEYLVTFEKPEIESSKQHNFIETEIDAFQGKYSDPAQSQWKVKIARGENSLEPFELE
jgi:hypothetical protein